MGGLIATLFAWTVLAALKPAQLVEIAAQDVRLSDVADLSGVDRQTAAQLGSRIIARLPDAEGTFQLRRADVQTLARRAVPILNFAGAPQGSITIRGPAPAPQDNAQACAEVHSSIAADQAISIDDVVSTECSDERAISRIRFSRTDGQTYAADSLQPGDYLGALKLTTRPAITRGQQLTLRSAVGPAVIERPVTAMQNAGASRRVFVRSPEGDVFAAPVEKEPAQ